MHLCVPSGNLLEGVSMKAKAALRRTSNLAAISYDNDGRVIHRNTKRTILSDANKAARKPGPVVSICPRDYVLAQMKAKKAWA